MSQSEQETKRGRPKKPPAEKRSSFTVWLNDREVKTIEEKAERAGLRRAVYLRRAALDRDMLPAGAQSERDQLINELSAVGNNLNQIARHLNKGGGADPKRLDETLAQLGDALSRV
jgi:hypothetical protein